MSGFKKFHHSYALLTAPVVLAKAGTSHPRLGAQVPTSESGQIGPVYGGSPLLITPEQPRAAEVGEVTKVTENRAERPRCSRAGGNNASRPPAGPLALWERVRVRVPRPHRHRPTRGMIGNERVLKVSPLLRTPDPPHLRADAAPRLGEYAHSAVLSSVVLCAAPAGAQ